MEMEMEWHSWGSVPWIIIITIIIIVIIFVISSVCWCDFLHNKSVHAFLKKQQIKSTFAKYEPKINTKEEEKQICVCACNNIVENTCWWKSNENCRHLWLWWIGELIAHYLFNFFADKKKNANQFFSFASDVDKVVVYPKWQIPSK